MRDTLSPRERVFGRVLIWLGVLLSFVVAGIAYALLPEQVPDILTLDGYSKGMIEKSILLFVLPIVLLIIEIALEVVPYLDPTRDNYVRFETSYYALRAFIAGTFLLLTIMNMVRLKYYEDIISFVAFKEIIAIAIILIGNILPKLKRNYFVGFTFPWCIASENVWFKTHRFGARCFVIIGCVMAIVAFVDNIAANVTFWCLIVTLLIAPMVYAAETYYLDKKRTRKEEE